MGFELPKILRLRKPFEFKEVYSKGRRFDGSYMTAFVLPNDFGQHRIGVTASRRLSKSAVLRNRAKRLLRESFRLSKQDLVLLENSFDWVLNARHTLLNANTVASQQEFRQILARVGLYASKQVTGRAYR